MLAFLGGAHYTRIKGKKRLKIEQNLCFFRRFAQFVITLLESFRLSWQASSHCTFTKEKIMMKYLWLSIAFFSLAYANEIKSGDQQLDRWLVNIDFVHQDNRTEAIEKLAKRFKIKSSVLFETNDHLELGVADLTLVLAIEKVTMTEYGNIVEAFRRYRASGVKAVLQNLGVEPTSLSFTEIKSIIQTHAPEGDPEADSRNRFKMQPKKG